MAERKWLKQYREYLGLSQNQMALKLDVPKSTYTSYESGYRTPSVDRAKKLAPKINAVWSIFFESNVLDMRTLVIKNLILTDQKSKEVSK